MGELIVPQACCTHPIDQVICHIRSPAGDLRPESVRAVIQCLQCVGYWTPDAAPIKVIDDLRTLLDNGRYSHDPGHA